MCGYFPFVYFAQSSAMPQEKKMTLKTPQEKKMTLKTSFCVLFVEFKQF